MYLTGAKSESRRANTPVYAPILKKITFPIYREDAIMEETKIILSFNREEWNLEKTRSSLYCKMQEGEIWIGILK